MSLALLWETFVWLVFKLQKWLSIAITGDFLGDSDDGLPAVLFAMTTLLELPI